MGNVVLFLISLKEEFNNWDIVTLAFWHRGKLDNILYENHTHIYVYLLNTRLHLAASKSS